MATDKTQNWLDDYARAKKNGMTYNEMVYLCVSTEYPPLGLNMKDDRVRAVAREIKDDLCPKVRAMNKKKNPS